MLLPHFLLNLVQIIVQGSFVWAFGAVSILCFKAPLADIIKVTASGLSLGFSLQSLQRVGSSRHRRGLLFSMDFSLNLFHHFSQVNIYFRPLSPDVFENAKVLF
jgi:hypothetical protein